VRPNGAMVGKLEILIDELSDKITVAEDNLIKAEMAATLAKMKVTEGILLVIVSKEAVARSKEILYKLKDI
jgi:hypothetical protein